LVCGADLSQEASPATVQGELEATLPTEIGGWAVVERLPSSAEAWERFGVEQQQVRALLTLYASDSEPDPSVHEVLRRMDRDHIPELLATGRWNGRAFEVTERIHGTSLAADREIDWKNQVVVRRVIDELGRALAGFAELGLRHRNLTPETILVRTSNPLDLVITGFGSARLSDFDLDAVAALELTRYSSPETIVGGVAAASDWWSLGVILLERLTAGACFEDVNEKAFHIHVVTRGISLPISLDSDLRLLLRGLLARDPLKRWQWREVRAWLDGKPLEPPAEFDAVGEGEHGPTIGFGERQYHRPQNYALAAAEAENWDQAEAIFLSGGLATWLEEVGTDASVVAAVRRIASDAELPDRLRHALALMTLNPALPLTLSGEIITPAWLLAHPQDGYGIITGPLSRYLERMAREPWLVRLGARAVAVREKARVLGVELEEDRLRVALLASSRTNLDFERATLRRIYPDTEHTGLAALMEHERLTDEEIIVLISARSLQFIPLDTLLDATERLAVQSAVQSLDRNAAAALITRPRREIYAQVEKQIAGFAGSSLPRLNEWADSFRVERRISLPRAAVLLSLESSEWVQPPKQQYVAALLEHFEKRVVRSVQRGPLVRFTIGRTTPRIDVSNLGTATRPATAIVDHILRRSDVPLSLDPLAFVDRDDLLSRLRRLVSYASTFKRDTGIDGRYLAFPFLVMRDSRLISPDTKARIAPVLLWPLALELPAGSRGNGTLAFDSEREDVRLNPALEGLVGSDVFPKWNEARKDLLSRQVLRVQDVMDIFGSLATPSERILRPVPSGEIKLASGSSSLICAAAIFNAEFTGQAVAEDLRLLHQRPPGGTSLETALLVSADQSITSAPIFAPEDSYLTVESDPSQEIALATARQSPGVLLEGPPGTGKSQTIVNVVSDCIGRGETVLVVCQKQAALRVVEKRLQAEGLGMRLATVLDAVRDREPIVRSIRDQLDRVRNNPPGTVIALAREREAAAANVSSLERELDRHQLALYGVDEITGLNYRQVLSNLILIESSSVPLGVPGLRSRFASQSRVQTEQVEEICAPLARLWLASKYEFSSLSVLEVFPVDSDTADKLARELATFAAAEKNRASILPTVNPEFEISDPVPYRAWFAAHDARFTDMPVEERTNLAHWFDEFTNSPGQIDSAGVRAIANLKATIEALKVLPIADSSDDLLEKVSSMPITEIRGWSTLASSVTAEVSFLGQLSITRFLGRHRCKSLLIRFGCDPTELNLLALRDTLGLEIKLRPLRKVVQDLLEHLQEERGRTAITVRQIATHAHATLAALETTQADVAAVSTSPAGIHAQSMAEAGTSAAYVKFREDVNAAIQRYSARIVSNAALDVLSTWFVADWTKAQRTAVNGNLSPPPGLDLIMNALPTLEPFQRFRSRAKHLDEDTLAVFATLRPYEETLGANPKVDLDEVLRRIIQREALLGWKMRIENAHPALHLQPEEIDRKIERLARAEAEMRSGNRELLSGGIDFQSLGAVRDWEAITRLRGPRAKRLREVIERGRDIGLMQLRPVWLMNPDTASRVLPLNSRLFDVVVFDEASQMLVEHAVPSLYRAKRVVVCGDEKQMPPTSFFSARGDSDEDEEDQSGDLADTASDAEREIYEDTWNRREIKDCPDLLSLARVCLPQRMLQIHYRSNYRELINYSNAAFYKGSLSIPARHPDAETRKAKPIEVVRTDSVYESQTNPSEAAKVVDILANLWRDKPVDTPSVGIVTFNRKQADLIEEQIESRASRDTGFLSTLARERERVQNGEDMGFFVKNVENVQGDERDVIIFSTTFGRDRLGSFKRYFGVLGQRGGERRLNVAVTRARDKILLVTSMPIADVSDMLSVSRSPNKPRDYLQAYLDYATKVSLGELDVARLSAGRLSPERTTQARGREPDGFVEAVASYVREMGFSPLTANDGDTFGVDITVEDSRTGHFGLAIECDSPRDDAGHLSSARARELWRPRMLKRAIPVIHRVSSYGWYHSRDEERLKLRSAVEGALCEVKS
jgi:hypothetical protein